MRHIFNLLPWTRRRLEGDLDREVRYHVERRVADLIASGVGEEDARRRVRLELGGMPQIREQVRDVWIARWLDHVGRDVRYAVRTLIRNPGFAATAMLSFALGIGANAAIFSLVDHALLRRLPVSEPARLVHVAWRGNSLSSSWGTGNLMSYPLCRELDQQTQFFDGAFCRHPTSVFIATGQQHLPARAEIVSGSYFPVLGVRPHLGRLIDRSDDLQPGAHPVVVLSHDYWTTQLASAPDVVGRKVLVNSHPMTVIGVAPAGFRGVDPLDAPAVWIPAMMKRPATPEWDRLLDRRAAWLHVFARVKRGAAAETTGAALQPWFASAIDAESRSEDFPKATREQRQEFFASTIHLLPAANGLSSARLALERPLLVLLGGTALLVVLAMLNVASLLLARGAARTREVTTRMALGASRGRIASQLLVESLFIALLGGFVGLDAALAVSKGLLAFLPEGVDLQLGMDQRIFLFALAISVVTGATSGLVPAWRAGRTSLVFKERSGFGGRGTVRLRKAIVVTQMAFALVLLTGAGLFVRTLAELYARDLGFVPRDVVMFRVEPDAIGYSASDAPRLVRDLMATLQGVPAIESVSVANSHVLSGGSPRRVFTIESDTRVVTERAVPIMRVGPRFFATVGTPVVSGREFTEADTRDIEKTGYRAVVVNESFARRYLGGRNPVGYRVGVGNQPDTQTTIEIVGMIKDFSFRHVRVDAEPEHVFFPFAETGPLAGNGSLYLKLRGEPESALASIRTAVARVDARLPLISLTTIEDRIGLALKSERMLATLSSAFAVIALLLAVIGVYGVLSFVVTQRKQEIGVRLALGATRFDAVWLVLRDALVMVSAGTIIALPATWMLRRLVESQLFGVRAFDGPTLAVAFVLLGVVALGAAAWPAWRAASVDPTDALRPE
jgi:predicted permease